MPEVHAPLGTATHEGGAAHQLSDAHLVRVIIGLGLVLVLGLGLGLGLANQLSDAHQPLRTAALGAAAAAGPRAWLGLGL